MVPPEPVFIHFMQNESNLQVDTIDILSEVLNRFGNQLVPGDASSTGPQLQRQIQNALIHLLNHKRFAIRKRTTVAIGSLVAHTSDDLFASLMKQLLAELSQKEQLKDKDRLRTHIGCVATIRYECIEPTTTEASLIGLSNQSGKFSPIRSVFERLHSSSDTFHCH